MATYRHRRFKGSGEGPARLRPVGVALPLALLLALPAPGRADITGLTAANVTPYAFSVVWVADEAVTAAAVRVFADSDGLQELTVGLPQELISGPAAHALGIVHVDIQSAEPGQTYYIQTETEGASGIQVAPDPGLLLAVTTPVTTALATDDGTPIANDLLLHDLTDPASGAGIDGSLVLVRLPALSPYPLTAFTGHGIALPSALVDLNNLYGADGRSAATVAGMTAQIIEYRGLWCDDLSYQALLWQRRIPAEGAIPLTEVSAADACFAPQGIAADFNCNGAVEPGDFNELLIRFNSDAAVDACKFHADFDLDGDGRVGPGDFNSLLIVFGARE